MEITAPSHWRCVDFISDIHLDASEPQTFALWSAYLAATRADAVFILGDLFEVWVGDDVLIAPGTLERAAVTALHAAGTRLNLYLMAGNRDFLMGPALMAQCAATAVSDPCVLIFSGRRWVLSHGDALCTADTNYQAFRQLVRSPAWQSEFLAKPLLERQAIARAIRAQSESRKLHTAVYADVNPEAATQLLLAHHATALIHGHTHKPATIPLNDGLERIVLSDWVADIEPPRADVIRLQCDAHSNPQISRLSPGAIVREAQG